MTATASAPARRDQRRAAAQRPSTSAIREQADAISEARARRRDRERRERNLAGAARARSRQGVIDLAVVTVLLLTAAIGLRPVWGGAGPWLAVGGGLVLGLAIAWTGAVRRWGILTITAITMVVFIAFGGAFALPHTTIAGVVPTLSTLRGLLLGTVTVWKDWVTVAPPLAIVPDLGVAPFLTTLVATVIAAGIAVRSRRGVGALIVVTAFFVLVIAGSSTQEAFPLAQGIVAVVVALGWASWRLRPELVDAGAAAGDETQQSQRSILQQRRARGTAALLGGTVLVTALVAPLVAPAGQRVVLRDVIVPPLELHDFTSPLVGFRSYVKDHAESVLFTVDGLPAGARLRLATLDTYTGTVMDVAGGTAGGDSGAFRRVGARLPEAPALSGPPLDEGHEVTVGVTVGDYADVWLPVLGEPLGVEFAGPRADELRRGLHLNAAGPTALATAGLRSGDSFTMTSTVRPNPSGTQLAEARYADVTLPSPQSVPDAIAATVDRFVAEDAGLYKAAQDIRDGLAGNGVRSSGREGDPPSRAGHGADRIATLLAETQPIGDDEQFAVAMALMARQRGIPARVVMGYFDDDAPDGVAPEGPVEVRGADIHAWVEVPFEGIGWVPFDPWPDDSTPPEVSNERSNAQPQRQQLLQPPAPEEPEEPPTQPLLEDAEEDELEADDEPVAGWFLAAGIAAGSVLLLALPFVVIAALKARRRARRRRAGTSVARVIGGWDEVVDLGRDLGHDPRSGATRRETGRDLEQHFPEGGVATLARSADAGVFGPGEPDQEAIDALWLEVDQVLTSMTRSVGPWARTKAKFSVRSLRRRKRDEVVR